jgi:GNAT superfamily N-acetyltransferase
MNPRPLAWEDIPRVHNLLARRWADDDPRAQMHIGDLYWALRPAGGGDPFSDTRVWPREDGSLAAFAWLDPPTLGDAIVDPAELQLLDEALDWLEGEYRARGISSITVILVAGDAPRLEALERRGYALGDGGNMRLWQRLASAPIAPALPAGYSLGQVSTPADIERRVFVESDSFGDFTLTAETWRFVQRLPTYRPELDIIAVAPGGTGAAACTCWYDAATRCGEFEAVGTAQAHRRRGLGRAVIVEGLRRLHELGATTAVVFTQNTNDAAIALYESCGFEIVAEDRAWNKSL